MRIYSMTATFGKLEHETLQLEPGLNILQAPNEWGKSTWCAFLVAMLYGVETRVHTTKTAIADKERYAPWSGSPMSGRVELSWQGRDITIQRSTRGRIPMGEFRAYETKTGLPVPELTAQNCGQQLLGVEKAVFLRSAFLRGSDLAVEQEESLRRRLHALVTTGDESATADDLAKKLKELKNRCRANRTTGLLPQAYQRRAELEQDLRTLHSLQRQSSMMEQQIEQLESQMDQLELHRQTMDYRAGLEDGQKHIRAEADLEKAVQNEKQCREAVTVLPPKDRLEEQLRELTDLVQKRRMLRRSLEEIPPITWERQERLQPDSALRAAADAGKYQHFRLWGWLLLVLAAVAAVGGVLCYAEGELLSLALWAAAGLCLTAGIWLLVGAGKLRRSYGDMPSSLWAAEAQRLLQEQARADKAERQAQELRQRLRDTEQRILALTGGKGSEACLDGIRQGLAAYARLEEAIGMREHAARLAAAMKCGEIAVEVPKGTDTLSYSRQETKQLLAECASKLQELQLGLGACLGQIGALGQPSDLREALKELDCRIARLEDTYAALEIALNTLAEARSELQRRFAPQIVKKTQALFSALTGGRYDQLAMEEDLRLHIRADGEDTLRSSLWRSEGTVDQLYLALRLAVASELMPDKPLILDDALVRFDDVRLKLAMELLRKEAQNRQILLFTCQSREKTACNL